MSKPNSASPYTLETWLSKARNATSKNNPKAAEDIAGKVLKLNKTDLATKSHQINLTTKQVLKLNNFLGKLLVGRPLASVLHRTEFHNISLKINGRVLSPRAETEELVEYAIKTIPQNSQVFDIGTGSGAIGLSVAKARPDLEVTLTDISNQTLNIAKLNARNNNITAVKFIKSNLIKKLDQSLLINSYFIANLPYVNPNWKGLNHNNLKHEPYSALFASSNGLQIIYNLLNQIKSRGLLTEENYALLEHDPKQLPELTSYASELNYVVEKLTDFTSLVKLK